MPRNIMELQHEFQENKKRIHFLMKRNKFITKELKSHGQKPLRKQYMEKPIMLYALRLESDFYYVGMSRNVDKRFRRHVAGKGSVWTKKYRPIEILETRATNTNDDSEAGLMEDAMTIEYAQLYGYDNVRGGGYCQTKPQWPPEVSLGWIRVEQR